VKFFFIRDLNEEERRKPRKERIPVFLMCEVLDVSRSGFYAWLTRATSDRAKEDAELTVVIKKIHDDHEGRLGIDRLVAELAKLGRRHSPQRVRRLARAEGLSGVHPRPYRTTTVQDEANPDGLVESTVVHGHHLYSHVEWLGVSRLNSGWIYPQSRRLVGRGSYAHESGHRGAGDGDHPAASRHR
jgi:hypothetical protein